MSLTNTVEGVIPMSIYSVLKGEHNEVSAIFKTLELAPESLEMGREGLFKKLRKELLSHAKAEQAAVYDLVKQKTSNPQWIQEAEQEHADLEARLNKILPMFAKTEAWKVEVQMLKMKVEKHVQEEESQTFNEMKALFTDEEARDMAKNFHDLKKQEMAKIKD